ncbi:MAG TPA: transposase [Chloroflexota bacterium]|nr:transposase [Chloroflexota bacterium]
MLMHGMDDAAWDARLARLGEAIDLEASARTYRALLRRRGIRTAAQLLRLCLAYVLGGLSLRMLAAWSQAQEQASLSDVAVLNRLRASADWLGAIVSALLAQRYPEAVAEQGQRRLLAVDSTSVVPPGNKRDYCLVHSLFDLRQLSFRCVEVSDRREAERLSRGGVCAGEVRIADRGHAHAEELAAVVQAGADFIVRAAANYPSLVEANGSELDRLELCRRAAREGVVDHAVLVAKAGLRVPARLVILPVEPEAAQHARERARRNARRWGYEASPAGIEMAGYLMLLTSLDTQDWPAARVLSSYRLRWQVELAFKRLKSIVGLEALRAKDPDLTRAWINAALIAALLAEEEPLPEEAEPSPEAAMDEQEEEPALTPEAPASLPLCG